MTEPITEPADEPTARTAGDQDHEDVETYRGADADAPTDDAGAHQDAETDAPTSQ